MTLLCRLEEMASVDSRGFSLNGLDFFVVRREHEVFAYVNACPHIGVPLDFRPHRFLTPDKQYILCSTHGAIFTVEDGLCRRGPCPGESLERIDVDVRDGWVRLATVPQ
jgi:nitrite reductase/ring-hydroxylating ferredoxin subunit